jgi:AbiTii-like protein
VPRQQTDELTALELEIRDRAVSLADVLRSCLSLARRTGAVQLNEWATAELKGYWPFDTVPDYRRIAAPIFASYQVPYQGLVTQPFNLQVLPERVRTLLDGPVPLNQPVDELEAIADQYAAQRTPVQLDLFCSDLLMSILNKNNPHGPRVIAMTWSIDPSVIRGVLGQVRTKLMEFIAELRTEVGDSTELPSAERTDSVLRSVLPSAVFYNSTVTIVTATTKNGDIMPDGPRTTIKGNKTKIRDTTGNVSVASAHVAQVNGDGIDIEKLERFANFVTQIAPTLGLSADQQMELEAGVDELHEAAADPVQSKGRFRTALGRVVQVLGVTAKSTAQQIAVSMGDELIRELGEEIVRELPH